MSESIVDAIRQVGALSLESDKALLTVIEKLVEKLGLVEQRLTRLEGGQQAHTPPSMRERLKAESEPHIMPKGDEEWAEREAERIRQQFTRERSKEGT